jgi:hypothetical protein
MAGRRRRAGALDQQREEDCGERCPFHDCLPIRRAVRIDEWPSGSMFRAI